MNYKSNFSLHRFECECGTFDHNMRLEVDKETGAIVLSIAMNNWRSLWQRIWLAVKFIFKSTERYGHYDTVELNQSDYNRLRYLLDESEKILNDYQEHV